MSRDIRSFFQSKKVPKTVFTDDDDVIPESPEVQIRVKKKESRKKRILSDDSDDEVSTNTKKKKVEKLQSDTVSKHKKSPQKPKLKEVKAVDIFGSSKVQRTEPLIKKSLKRKTETGIHSDDEFDQSLLALDEVEATSLETTAATIKTDQNKSETDKEKAVKSTDLIKLLNGNESNKSKDLNSCSKSHKSNTKSSPKKSKLALKKELINANNDTSQIETSSNKMETSKKDFSEFLEDDKTPVKEKPSNSKRKMNTSLNDSVLTDEERHERKMYSCQLYQKYLNRSGPKHLGSKEIPKGAPNCLSNCAFLLTGVLDSFEREEIAEAISKYGGVMKNSISKKVTHVLAGDDAGPAKMAKAQELGIKILSEDEFLQLIKDSSTNSSDKTSGKKDIKKDKSPTKQSKRIADQKSKRNGVDESPSKVKKESNQSNEKFKVESDEKIVKKESNRSNDKLNIESNEKKVKKESNRSNDKLKVEREEKKERAKSKSPVKIKREPTEQKNKVESKVEKDSKMDIDRQNSNANIPTVQQALMWVDKYKPNTVKQIIGQHGDASNVKKLSNWLTKWYVNRKAKLPKPSPWTKNDDGGYYKAALLSGPPGVGKTTTVSLVCKELGFDVVEFNASDTRNKSLMKEQIGELLTTTSLSGYAKGQTGKQAVTKKHVLVMDEVDGMAGNEDRGGLQELILLIKSSSVPIICTCNDRNSQKMRSLVNYCYDLRFTRPRVDQIKSAMLSICFKEGIKIPPDAITQLIVAANQDVRQTLNLLSMWAVDPGLADSERLNKDAKVVRKDIKLGPWEAVRKVFSADEHKTMSIHDKSDLFFCDYSIAPLFVQENYLHVTPNCPKNEILDRLSKAADSISTGDLIEARIRKSQAWGLLPTQAMFSSVIPGHMMSGQMTKAIQFPGWLGKNSRANKMHRLCQEIHAHTRLSTSGSKSSIYLDYAPHLRDAILNPLIKDHSDGVDKALEILESYHLLREDLDSLVELSLWPGQRNPMVLVDTKVKAAMTRTYNKRAVALPYASVSIKKVKSQDTEEFIDDNNEEENEDDEQDSDPENDAMIKKKKTKVAEKASSSKEKASSSKEKPSSSKEKAGSSKGKGKKK